MSRKMFVDVKVRLVIDANEDIELNSIMDDIDYNFESGEGFEIVDTEISEYELVDSK